MLTMLTKKFRPAFLAGAALLSCVLTANSAHGALIASETFDYTQGTYISADGGLFTELNGGTGWSIPFRSHFGAGQAIEIGSGPTGGFFDGTAINANNFTRDRIMSSNTSTDVGTVTWQVMYLSTDGGTGGGFQVNNQHGGRDYQVSIDGSGNYQFIGGHGGDTIEQNLGIAASNSINSPDVLLFKTEVLAGSQMTTSLWIAPNLASEAALGAPTSAVTYNAFAGAKNIGQININPNGTVRVDDIHFGTDFADVVSVLTPLPPPPPAGDKIGWNFVMRSGSELAPSELAGFTGFEQINWNNDGPNGQASSGGISNLMDNNGLPTGVDVSWVTTAGNSWNMNGPLNTPDGKLNDGFLNQQPTLTVDGLSEEFGRDGYSLVVYYNNNEGPGTTDITVAGLVDDLLVQRMMTGPTDATRWEENGYLLEEGFLTSATNVMIFEGLNDLGFTLSFTTVGGNGNNGITAFQIVKNAQIIPEPTTAMLLGIAGCGLAMIRRSRREGAMA